MKKILIGLLALTAASYAKEVVPAPIVQEEAKVVEQVYIPEKYYNAYFRAGGDVYSQFNEIDPYRVDLGGKSTKGLGYDLALELTKLSVNRDWEVGLGVAYQRHADFKSTSGLISELGDYESDLDSFDSFPIYLTMKYNFLDFTSGVVPYIKADAGYAINTNNSGRIKLDGLTVGDTDVKNGGYFGLGVGMEYENFFTDIMYKLNTGKLDGDVEIGGDSYDFEETVRNYRVTLSVGYKFNF